MILDAATFLEKEGLQQAGGPDHLSIAEWKAQAGGAGVKVIDEAPHHRAAASGALAALLRENFVQTYGRDLFPRLYSVSPSAGSTSRRPR
jgi:hypothetical protein